MTLMTLIPDDPDDHNYSDDTDDSDNPYDSFVGAYLRSFSGHFFQLDLIWSLDYWQTFLCASTKDSTFDFWDIFDGKATHSNIHKDVCIFSSK